MDPKSVLIVEDEAILAKDYEMIVGAMGYNVLGSAHTGYDALLLSSRYRPDVVLMDIKLDGHLNGITAAREIQEHLSIPVVFLTGILDEETRKRAIDINPAAYLVKPLDESMLKETLAGILGF